MSAAGAFDPQVHQPAHPPLVRLATQALGAVLAVVLPAVAAAALLVVCLVAGGERVQAAMNATVNAAVSAPAQVTQPGESAPAKAGANPLEKLRPLLKPSAPSGLLQEVAAPIAVQQLQEALADQIGRAHV